MYGGRPSRDKRLINEVGVDPGKVIPELTDDVDGLWIHSAMEVFMGRLFAICDQPGSEVRATDAGGYGVRRAAS